MLPARSFRRNRNPGGRPRIRGSSFGALRRKKKKPSARFREPPVVAAKIFPRRARSRFESAYLSLSRSALLKFQRDSPITELIVRLSMRPGKLAFILERCGWNLRINSEQGTQKSR